MNAFRLIALTLAAIAVLAVLLYGSLLSFGTIYFAVFAFSHFPVSPHRWELLPVAGLGLLFGVCLWLLPILHFRLKHIRPQVKFLILVAWGGQLLSVIWYMGGAKRYGPLLFGVAQERYGANGSSINEKSQ